MVYFKPITDKGALAERFGFEPEPNIVYGGYIGYESDSEEVGSCLLKVHKYNCAILRIDCDMSDKLLTEGFIRAALNFAANRNAYLAFCEIGEANDVLLSLGFENNNGVYSGDIPTLLKGSCCK